MLRIKDSVVLQELEKFRFEKEEDTYVWNNPFNNYMIMVHKSGRTITTRLDTDANEILYDLIQARISRKNRRKEVIGKMGEREYNLWLVLLVILKNSIAIICFTILAITFNIWWIALFSILFMSSVESKKEDK